jgi:uncharacterized membrane protein
MTVKCLVQSGKGRARAARAAVAAVGALLCLGMICAPLLAARSQRLSAVIYLAFAPVCHQMPERSFTHHGYPWAVCHRCAGIYLGLFLAALLPIGGAWVSVAGRRRRIRVALAVAPLLVDWALAFGGLWPGAAWSRFGTGALFGAMVATLLVPGLEELIDEVAHACCCLRRKELKGVVT